MIGYGAYFNFLKFYFKFWDRQVTANNVDQDQMPQNVPFDQSLHCLPLI